MPSSFLAVFWRPLSHSISSLGLCPVVAHHLWLLAALAGAVEGRCFHGQGQGGGHALGCAIGLPSPVGQVVALDVQLATNPKRVMQAGLPVRLSDDLLRVAQTGQTRLPELMLQLPRAYVAQAAQCLGALLAAAAKAHLTIKRPCHPDWQAVQCRVQVCGVAKLLTRLSNPMQLLWAQAKGGRTIAPAL